MVKAAKKRYTTKELEFCKRIFSVLLSGKGSCLHNIESGFVYSLVNGPQHFAVERLLAGLDLPQEFANIAANAYLDRFKKAGHPMLRDTGALEYAEQIADRFSVSRETAERLVGCMAEAGWHGWLEGCARRYCNRAPTPSEVVLLFDSYKKSASWCSSTDETLAAYAKKYMPADQAQEQLRLLEERNRRFHAD